MIPNQTITWWLLAGWFPLLVIALACVVFAVQRRSGASVGLAIGAVGLPLSVLAEVAWWARWVPAHQHLLILPSIEPARTAIGFAFAQLIFALVFAVSLWVVLSDANRVWRNARRDSSADAGASTSDAHPAERRPLD